MFSHLRFNSPTILLIIVTILSFIFQMAYEPVFTQMFVLEQGALFDKQYSLITHMFLHANFSHLLFNMLGIFIFGSLLERAIRDYQYYLLYFGSGLIAGIVGSFIYSAALGASAGVMALVGACAFIYPRVLIYLFGVFPMQLRTLAFIYFIYDLIGSFGLSNVASEAHIIGMFSGIGFAYLITKTSIFKSRSSKRGLNSIKRVEAHISGKDPKTRNTVNKVVVFDNEKGNSKSSSKDFKSVDDFSKKMYVTVDESDEYMRSKK